MRLCLPTAAAVLASTALLAAGCGGDDDEDPGPASTGPATTGTEGEPASGADAREIQALVKRSFTSDEPRVACKTFTTRLQRAIYGSPEACLRQDDDPDDENDPTGARTTDIAVDGDTATGEIALVGGVLEGPLGPMGFARDGGEWRIDRLEDELLRTILTRAFRSEEIGEEAEDFASAEVRDCYAGALGDLPPATVRRVAYAVISDQEPADRDVVPPLLRCQLRTEDGRALLRRRFQGPVLQQLERLPGPEAFKACVRDRVRSDELLDEIVQGVIRRFETGSQDDGSRAIGEAAARACAQEAG